MNVPFLLSYLGYVGSGLVLMVAFMFIYERLTPYRELELMREGNLAAALSFGGALLGFTLTLASSAMHAHGWQAFLAWSAVAGVVQLAAFVVVAASLKQIRQHIENGNVAAGAALFFMSVSLGALNAAAMT